MDKNILLATALTLTSCAAFAAAPEFSEIDINNDGAISAEEAATVEGLDLAGADVNGDGLLNLEEYVKATQGK